MISPKRINRKYNAPCPASYDAESAWDFGITGEGLKIAVINSGVNCSVFPSGELLSRARDFTGEGLDDVLGHGTYLAQVIAKRDEPYRGIAPHSQIVSAKIIGSRGTKSEWVVDGVSWAAQQGCQIFCVALSAELFKCITSQAIPRLIESIGQESLLCLLFNRECNQDLLDTLRSRLPGLVTFCAYSQRKRGQRIVSLVNGEYSQPDIMAPAQTPALLRKRIAHLELGGPLRMPNHSRLHNCSKDFFSIHTLQSLTACGLVTGSAALVMSFLSKAWPELTSSERVVMTRQALEGVKLLAYRVAPECLNVLHALDWSVKLAQAKSREVSFSSCRSRPEPVLVPLAHATGRQSRF